MKRTIGRMSNHAAVFLYFCTNYYAVSKMKKNNSVGGFVFSTDPNFRPSDADESPVSSAPAAQQNLRIWLDRLKGNKEATVIRGFAGSDADLAELARLLKNKCASGGNAKDGEIILQGDHREKVLKLLLEQGYSKTKKAGG
jgi:translation initiation factor 1